MEETRICKKCGKDKLITKFQLARSGKSRGRTCMACIHKDWYHSKGKARSAERLAKQDATEPLRTCNTCGLEKNIVNFGEVGGGYRRRTCKLCCSRADETTFKLNGDVLLRKGTRSAQEKVRRVCDIPKTIYTDCRGSDRKKGFPDSDLTVEIIAKLLYGGCRYCGETDLRMTLDRIDTSQGHSVANVVPACLRCNYHRGSMPYEAWLHIAPAVRSARELGLFGTWRSKPFNKKS